MVDKYDVIVIGGGLEGVAHALGAAQQGARVGLFEARAEFGGRLGQVDPFGTGEKMPFNPLIWGVGPETFRYLGLRPLELGLVPAPRLTVVGEATSDAAGPFTFYADHDLTRASLGTRAPFEMERLVALQAALARAAMAQDALSEKALDEPRRRGAFAEDNAAAWAKAFAVLSPNQQRELMRFAVRPCADVLDAYLNDTSLKLAIEAFALFSHPIGPRAPGSALALLSAPPLMPAHGNRFAMPFLVTEASDRIHQTFLTQLHDRGVNFEIGCRVVELHVGRGGISHVAMTDGRTVKGTKVISTLDSKATLLGLVNWKALPAGLARRAGALDIEGSHARIFLKVPERPPAAAQEMFKGPVYFNLDAADAAADAWAQNHVPNRPPFEVTVREATSPVRETHISALAQFIPYAPHQSEWDEMQIENLVRMLVDELETIWPGIRQKVADWAVWLPKDLEREFGWSRGATAGAPPGLAGGETLAGFIGKETPIAGLSMDRFPRDRTRREGMPGS